MVHGDDVPPMDACMHVGGLQEVWSSETMPPLKEVALELIPKYWR